MVSYIICAQSAGTDNAPDREGDVFSLHVYSLIPCFASARTYSLLLRLGLEAMGFNRI